MLLQLVTQVSDAETKLNENVDPDATENKLSDKIKLPATYDLFANLDQLENFVNFKFSVNSR